MDAPAGAVYRLRHTMITDPSVIWPPGRYAGDKFIATGAGYIDDLCLVGGLKFHPNTPTVASTSLSGGWKTLLRDAKAAKMQVMVGFAPQARLTADDQTFANYICSKTIPDEDFTRCASAIVTMLDNNLSGWSGLSFDVESISIIATPQDRVQELLRCRDRLTSFYQAVAIAAAPRLVRIIAGALITSQHTCWTVGGTAPDFVRGSRHPALDFAKLNDWLRLPRAPGVGPLRNLIIMSMAYDGEPGSLTSPTIPDPADPTGKTPMLNPAFSPSTQSCIAGRRIWHEDTITYAVSGTPEDIENGYERAWISESQFQLLVKITSSNNLGNPGMLRKEYEIWERALLCRSRNVGLAYFAGVPSNIAQQEELLNTYHGAPGPGLVDGQPLQGPIPFPAISFAPDFDTL